MCCALTPHAPAAAQRPLRVSQPRRIAAASSRGAARERRSNLPQDRASVGPRRQGLPRQLRAASTSRSSPACSPPHPMGNPPASTRVAAPIPLASGVNNSRYLRKSGTWVDTHRFRVCGEYVCSAITELTLDGRDAATATHANRVHCELLARERRARTCGAKPRPSPSPIESRTRLQQHVRKPQEAVNASKLSFPPISAYFRLLMLITDPTLPRSVWAKAAAGSARPPCP